MGTLADSDRWPTQGEVRSMVLATVLFPAGTSDRPPQYSISVLNRPFWYLTNGTEGVQIK